MKKTHEDYCRAWRSRNPEKYAYINLRKNSKYRGVDLEMTFEEFVEFWGDDFDKRGKTADDLVLCRYDDSGPYSVENCYKASLRENSTAPRSKEAVQ